MSKDIYYYSAQSRLTRCPFCDSRLIVRAAGDDRGTHCPKCYYSEYAGGIDTVEALSHYLSKTFCNSGYTRFSLFGHTLSADETFAADGVLPILFSPVISSERTPRFALADDLKSLLGLRLVMIGNGNARSVFTQAVLNICKYIEFTTKAKDPEMIYLDRFHEFATCQRGLRAMEGSRKHRLSALHVREHAERYRKSL